MIEHVKLGFVIIFSIIIFMFKYDAQIQLNIDKLSGVSIEMESIPVTNEVNEEMLNAEVKSDKDKEWKLVWEDNFEGVSIDQRKWSLEDWAADKNNELQYYSPKNVQVKDGLLQIVSRRESYGGRFYTSGALHTKKKFDFLYGKVEMKAKLPSGQGIFPAFWMMTNKEYTWLPEIDIMEMLGHKPDEVWMVMHWMGENRTLKSVSSSYLGPDYSKGFHIFGIEWTPEYIAWFIDGVERFRVDQNVPQEEMFLYLNTAIGGDWPGSPDRATPFPTVFQVDYVRVYYK